MTGKDYTQQFFGNASWGESLHINHGVVDSTVNNTKIQQDVSL
jgi:hypothetical protein